MIKGKAKKGFTLIEVLIAAGIFAVIASISTSILVTTINAEKKTDIRNAIYDDARVVMEQLSNYVQNNAIDYEEYYSVNVTQEQPRLGASEKLYGLYYGVYGSRFFDPGLKLNEDQGVNPQDLGVVCSDPVGEEYEDCSIFYDLSIDFNTGQNPHRQIPSKDPDRANAFCDEYLSVPCGAVKPSQPDLYLINADGTEKIIIVRQSVNANDSAVGLIKLEGVDSDQNGTIDLFKCEKGYDEYCETDLYDNYYNTTIVDFPGIEGKEDLDISLPKVEGTSFVPITPFRTNVKDLQFIITPSEDPYKGYDEIKNQKHPSVTIILTIEPSETEKEKYPGGWQEGNEVVIQRTINTGVVGDVTSYPPTNDLEWIDNVI
jgi:prepilin-type N-terminal cleavage/methylation domain-containing protein